QRRTRRDGVRRLQREVGRRRHELRRDGPGGAARPRPGLRLPPEEGRMSLTLAFLAAAVLAHDEGSSSSEIRITGKEVVWSVDVGTLGLQRVMDLGAPPHLLTREKLEPFRERIGRYLERGLTVEINGKVVTAETADLEASY